MAKVLVTETYLENIADSIRAKNGTGNAYKPSEMSGAIDALVVAQLGTKSITENGTYTATDDSVNGYSQVTVDVESDLGTKSITSNGTYSASDDSLDGYSSVTVNVSGGNSVDIDLLNYIIVSKTSGDKYKRSDRYFTRNTSEAVIVLCAGYPSDDSFLYSGYAVISFSSSGITGTYSSYGNLINLTENTTPNGTTYWVQQMNGMYPLSINSGKIEFTYDSTKAYTYIIPVTTGLYINGNNQKLAGDSTLVSAMETFIDAFYEKYYG